MAGQIVVSSIKTDSDNSISFLANTGATIFSANLASGLSASSFGNNTITSDKIVSVANTKITGNITSSQIVPNPVFNGNTTVTSLITESGITFPATQVASADANTLDDYEEGTWTPSLGGNTTYSITPSGTYTKIGRLVTVTFNCQVTTLGTGSAQFISGLPFAASTTQAQGGSVAVASNLAVNFYSITLAVAWGTSTQIGFGVQDALDGSTTVANASVFGDGARIDGNLTYVVA